jgi:toxin ParE2
MTLAIRFLPEAATELDEAVEFYNSRKADLGSEFASQVRDGLTRIQQYPKAWLLLGRRVRRYRLQRFPYGPVAVMHLHQKPNYWRSRLEGRRG